MTATSETVSGARSSRNLKIAGWAMTGLIGLFLAFDTTIKLLDLEVVQTTMAQLGWPPALDRTIGIIELVCLALYLVPRTAVLGAVLLTALCGGAIASHLRQGDPLFSHILFGVYLGVIAWGGLYLRDERVRRVLPLLR